MYATIVDLRAEGITVAMAADDRLRTLVEEAGGLIDRVTGWFFEPRTATLRLDGRGTPSLEPPVPPIRLGHPDVLEFRSFLRALTVPPAGAQSVTAEAPPRVLALVKWSRAAEGRDLELISIAKVRTDRGPRRRRRKMRRPGA